MRDEAERGTWGWLARSGFLALAALIPAAGVELALWSGGEVAVSGGFLAVAILGAAATLAGLVQAPLLAGAVRAARAVPPAGLAGLGIALSVVVPIVALVGAAWSDALGRVTVPSVRSWLMAAGLVLAAGAAVKAAWGVRAVVDRLWAAPSWTPCRAWTLMALLDAGVLAFVVVLGASFRESLPSAMWLVTAATFAVSEVLAVTLVAAFARRPPIPRNARGLAVVWVVLPVLFLAATHAGASLSLEATREVLGGRGVSSRVLWLLQRATDHDGDGASGWFGGRDCDDSDPSVYPQAPDVPGNGLDEDCDGEDADEAMAERFEVPSPFALSPAAGQKLNVVVICVDAVRADHVSFAGYSRKTTPNLDRLAVRSWYFEQAIAPSATTRETIPALLTGRYPSGIAWNRSGTIWQVGTEQRLLTEVLKAAGYRTIAVVDEWLDRFLPSFKRGFDHFEVPYGSGQWMTFGQVAAPYITYAAIREVEKTPPSRPFFLYAQFEAAHHPYVAHEGFPAFGTREVDRYDGEIAYVDHYVGILLDYLEYTKRLDSTLVVVFADHGEEFGEHGGRQHSHALHAESVHVPLLVRVPGTRAARVRERVSHVDVAPTILDVLGLRPEDMAFQGWSLLHHVQPGAVAPKERDIFSELMVIDQGPPRFRKAIYSGDHKLLWDMSDDTTLLYDVRRDPTETRPLDDEGVRARLLARLRAFVARGAHRPMD